MPASSGFSISIAAVDKTTATLDKINSKISGAQNSINRKLQTANAPMKRLQMSLNRTAHLLGGGKLAAGVAQVSKSFTLLNRSTYAAFGNVSRLLPAIQLLGGAGTVAGIAALERRFASLGQTLTNTGRLMNMDPAQLAQWEGAVKLNGGFAGDADSSLRGLQRVSTDARFGQNNQAAGMLQMIEGPDWQKKSQDINGTALAISRYLQTLHGAARANAIGNIESTFSVSDGFMSFLLRGPAAVQKSLADAKAHGSPNDAQIGAGNSLAQSLNAAQESIEGLATAISSKLAGPLGKIVDRFTAWTDKNRMLIAQDVGKVIDGIGKRIAAINLKPFEQIAERINSVVESIGGWQNVLIGVIAVLTASKVAAIALPFVQLSAAIAGLTSGPGSFGALGRALGAAGFAVVGGQIVKLAAEAAGAGQGFATVAGDAVSGAILGGRYFGPVGAGTGGALGAGYGLYEAHKESAEQVAARADAMTDYYRSQGLSAVQAAAMVGGFQQESTLDPTATNGNHYGIGQWDPARQADFQRIFGHSMQQGTLQEQMKFALDEMFNGKEGAAGKALLAAKTAPQATDAMLSYERPAAPGTYAWQNEHAWRLDKTAQILARQKDGGKYLPTIGPMGTSTPWPTDEEHQGLIGMTMPGTGMDREDRTSVLEVHTYDHHTVVRAVKQAEGLTITHTRTATPLPAAGI